MKEITISPLEAGQRFDKYLVKCLPNATKSFLYKIIAKKILHETAKSRGQVKSWQEGDVIQMFCR